MRDFGFRITDRSTLNATALTPSLPSRVVHLEGGINFRDIGGYAAGQRTTRWGKVFRAGVLCYFTLILLHEAGHAYFARRAGARPIAIRMFLLHGECRYEEPYYAKDDYIIAWGGVLAQLAVAIPLVVLDATMDVTEVYGLPVVVRYLGGMSLLIVAINLLPFPGLDGEKAWRLPKLMYREWRELRKPFRRRKR